MRDFVEKAPFGETPLLGLKVDDLQWSYPVRPGDVLSVTREIVRLARSRSKPDRGVVSMRMTVTNQDQKIVMSFFNLIQMPIDGHEQVHRSERLAALHHLERIPFPGFG